jgi:hypothetical protein
MIGWTNKKNLKIIWKIRKFTQQIKTLNFEGANNNTVLFLNKVE